MITDGQIAEYRDIITYDNNTYSRLGIDELLGLLAECIGDKQIIEVVNKYIDDFNEDYEECSKRYRAIEKIEDIIKGIGDKQN